MVSCAVDVADKEDSVFEGRDIDFITSTKTQMSPHHAVQT